MEFQQSSIRECLGISLFKLYNFCIVVFRIFEPMCLVIQHRPIQIALHELGVQCYCTFIVVLCLLDFPTVMVEPTAVVKGLAVGWVELDCQVVVLFSLVESVGVVVDYAAI